MKLEIINGQRLTPSGQWKKVDSIRIANGKIESIDNTDSSFIADQTFNAKEHLIAPGMIDLSTSLRDPGPSVNGTIASETAAAAKGGFTAVCCTPDTTPVNDSKAVTKLILESSRREQHCQVYPIGALTKGLQGDQLAEYAALKDAGCIALSNGFQPLQNLIVTQRCFEYAKTHNLCVCINPMEPSLYQGAIHEGSVSTTIGLQGIPRVAETIAVSQLLQLAELTQTRLHLSQLSCAQSVSLLEQAKANGLNVTADVAIDNLLNTHHATENFNSLYHCHPPLREDIDRLALIEGVKSGVIDAITSAHRPCEAAAKLMPFAETTPGMSTIELTIALARKLELQDQLALATSISALSAGAANVLGLPEPRIDVGATANLFIFNPNQQYRLNAEALVSKGKNTPYLGQTLEGQVLATINNGQFSYQFEGSK